MFFAPWDDWDGLKGLISTLADREALLSAQTLMKPEYVEKMSHLKDTPPYIQTHENGKYFRARDFKEFDSTIL